MAVDKCSRLGPLGMSVRMAVAAVVGACMLGGGVHAAPAFASWNPRAVLRPKRAGAECVRMAVAGAGKRSLLAKALEKPTGALAVSIEYNRDKRCESSENDLIVLSMQVSGLGFRV